jgi:hypothetical protein
MSKCTVRHNLLQDPQQPGPLGRHSALDEQSETILVEMLLEAFQSGRAMNKQQLLQIVRGRHKKTLTRGWINALIDRHLDALQISRSIPQEDTRLTVPKSQLEEPIHILQVHLIGKCAELVFNLDELGSAD